MDSMRTKISQFQAKGITSAMQYIMDNKDHFLKLYEEKKDLIKATIKLQNNIEDSEVASAAAINFDVIDNDSKGGDMIIHQSEAVLQYTRRPTGRGEFLLPLTMYRHAGQQDITNMSACEVSKALESVSLAY